MSWLKAAIENSKTPKESIIGLLVKNLSGYREKRDRSVLHASDVTKDSFCPRKWAIQDLKEVKEEKEYIPTALAITFDIGSLTARTLIEEWAGDAVIGNWECIRCGDFRNLTNKPNGWCSDGKKHIWEYREVAINCPPYSLVGSLDAIFSLGTPYWRVAELKILSPNEFDTILVPQPEHRIRTSLYLKMIEESDSIWKSKFNTTTATVLYVSRAYGRKNNEWNEILPLREFEIKRDDAILRGPLKKAKALKIFREEGLMPNGICSTAFEKVAQKCSVCKECFSGQYPAKVKWEDLVV